MNSLTSCWLISALHGDADELTNQAFAMAADERYGVVFHRLDKLIHGCRCIIDGRHSYPPGAWPLTVRTMAMDDENPRASRTFEHLICSLFVLIFIQTKERAASR